MAVAKLIDHVRRLHLTVLGLKDPLPPDVTVLFNSFLEDAQSSCGENSLVHDIPHQQTDARRDAVMMWLLQLETALQPAGR